MAKKAKAPTEDARPKRRSGGQTPEQRKRARWLAGLFATRQPQHPRSELVTDERSGKLVRRDLPPQSRATRKEFLAPMKLGGAFIVTANREEMTE